ncbi:hypothetical protein CRG98_011733 [Punica granatum]|uniref:Uncharacterized protein n=1 Tax=Punica granatum TaxID=22663 RepID=A0A2I0KH84_PUNGR|nr:hypothetical protein CRG98_011733 [Punica granatum]
MKLENRTRIGSRRPFLARKEQKSIRSPLLEANPTFGCTGYTFGRAGTRGRTCSGVHGRGRTSNAWLDAWDCRRARGASAGGQADVSGRARCRGCADVHACRGRPGRTGTRVRTVTDAGARGDGRVGAIAQMGVHERTRAGVIERLDEETGDGCTVHPRAWVEPETMKPTRND